MGKASKVAAKKLPTPPDSEEEEDKRSSDEKDEDANAHGEEMGMGAVVEVGL